MQTNYKTDAPKKPVNLTLNSDLIRLGKEMGLNLSSLAEEAIAQAVRGRIEAAWLQENAQAIQDYNQRIEAHGVFSDGLRSF